LLPQASSFIPHFALWQHPATQNCNAVLRMELAGAPRAASTTPSLTLPVSMGIKEKIPLLASKSRVRELLIG